MVTDDAPAPLHSRPESDVGSDHHNDDQSRDHDPAKSTIDHFFDDPTSPQTTSPSDAPFSSSTFVSPSSTSTSIFTRRPRLRPRTTPKRSSIIHEWPRGSPLTPPSRQPDFTHVPPTPAFGAPPTPAPVPVQYGYQTVMQYRMPRVPVRTPLSAYEDMEDDEEDEGERDEYRPEIVTDTPVPMAGGGMRHTAWLHGGRPHRPKRRDPMRDGVRALPRSESVVVWAQRMLLWTWALVRVAAVLLLAMIAWQIHYVVVQERARRPTAGWTAKMIASAAAPDEDVASAVLATVSEWNATAQVALDVVVEMVGLLSGRAKVALLVVVAVAVVPVPRIGEGVCGRRRHR
ncbi:hypothetical protein AMAG_12893 [Allomyces macrogynus ATCC 38327]|uniref:Uncharacterized protein n=1 Tax=Allomyces macrogynus (strain ATCC 38327) TaxID=578462 RepID=A0A0L0T0N6_ALLM3|nr:hypothetical protein AMAG_12893 [Allomyces macrogynus ATCC 38327]|eukprot:KNE68215.1 hypothetical protein AMAG_12893 [Allomyces macrogynus ATCC 38327]